MTIEAREKTPKENFKVEVGNLETAFKWLNMQRELGKLSISISHHNDTTELTIAELNLDNGLFSEIKTELIYITDKDSYIIQSAFSPHFEHDPNIENIYNINDLIESFRTAKLEQEKSAKLDLGSIAEIIKPGVNEKRYNVEINNDNQILIFTRQLEEVIKHEIAFHPDQFIYCLHSKSVRFGESYETFYEDVKNYSFIMQQLTNAIYQSKNISPPNTNLKISVSQDDNIRVDVLEEKIRKSKNMMRIVGMEDSGFEEEIRAKMLLETRPKTTFDDIGGEENTKEELKSIVDALINPEIFIQEGTIPPRGVLLYGPPGTGKTELAKAVANAADADIYIVRLADIVHHLYGKSERLLSAVFSEARKKEAAIILIDELDSLAVSRQYSSEINSRIVSILQTEMDGIDNETDNLVVIAATNRLEAIDKALLRPGRFNMLVEVELPNKESTPKVFDIHMRKAEDLAGKMLFAELDMDQLGQKSVSMELSGADIEELIRRVLVGNVRIRQQGITPELISTKRLVEEMDNYEKIRKAKSSIGFNPHN